jgi:hypothetical protein
MAMIETNEVVVLMGSETLTAPLTNVQIAESLCSRGDIREALIFYTTTYDQLQREERDEIAKRTIDEMRRGVRM